MNELQKKLARRREINGETSQTIGKGDDNIPVHQPEVQTTISPDIYSSKTSPCQSFTQINDGSILSELQKKLARRRTINGELKFAGNC